VNPFNKDIGIHQGRIALATAPEGTYVYELGHALLNDANVAEDDYHQVSQELTFTPQAKLLKASIVVTVPSELPPIGLSWEVSGWLNGQKMVSRKLRASKRVLVLDDIRISLHDAIGGSNVVAFRLALGDPPYEEA
jgi:hypothetical protein